MTETERRAIVWDEIERHAFRPNSPANWLSVYAKSLHSLWGIDQNWARFSLADEFIVTFLNLKCRYHIESESKYEFSFSHDSSDCFHWKVHVDPGFCSKASLQLPVKKHLHQQKDELRSDVEAVLNGMIFHPRCHMHLEDFGVKHVQLAQERGGLESHEIRIGGGIENAYIFLFHLRYQFCLVHTNVRRDERQRLIDLFEKTIRDKNKHEVSAKDLFNFKP